MNTPLFNLIVDEIAVTSADKTVFKENLDRSEKFLFMSGVWYLVVRKV